MVKKRELTQEEQDECAKLKALFESKKDALGLTQATAAEAIGMGQSGFGNYLRGVNALNLEFSIKAASVLICEISDFSPRLAKEHSAYFTRSSNTVQEPIAYYEDKPATVWQEPDPGIYRTVKLMRLNLSAGITGAPVEYFEDEDEPLFFKNAWFDKRKINPSKAAAMKVTGESMEPLLSSGDTVLVNTEEDQPRHDKVFAINIDGELVVKRLLEEREGWVLHSDNPIHRARPVTDSTQIIGRVRWIGRDEV